MRDISEIAAAFLELIRSAAFDILTSSRSYAEGGIAGNIPALRIDSYSESMTSFGTDLVNRPDRLSLVLMCLGSIWPFLTASQMRMKSLMMYLLSSVTMCSLAHKPGTEWRCLPPSGREDLEMCQSPSSGRIGGRSRKIGWRLLRGRSGLRESPLLFQGWTIV